MGFTFKDGKAREWNVTIDVDTAECIATGTDLDFLGDLKARKHAYERIMGDVRILLNVVWHIIKPTADEKKVTIDDWRKSINGDTIEAMTEALTRSIADFSPPHLRKMILAGWEKGKKTEDAAAQGATEAMDDADLEKVKTAAKNKVMQAFDEATQRFEKSSITSPEPSA